MTAQTPGQADDVPESYARYIRACFPPDETAGRWKYMTGPREREFWRSLDAEGARLRETAADNIRLRDAFAAVARDLDASADATRPSRKSEIERECAAMVRQILEET